MDNTLGKRRVLKRLLLSCVALFMIPFVTVFLVYNTANTTVRDEVIRSNFNSLNLFFSALDASISDACSAAMQIAGSAQFQAYAARGKLAEPSRGIEVYTLKQYLQTYNNGNFEDILVYYPVNDIIISRDHACLRTDLFHQTYQEYYTNIFDTAGDFRAFLKSDVRALITFMRAGEGDKSRLTVAYGGYFQGSSYKTGTVYTVFVILDPHTLNALVDNACRQSEGILMVFDNHDKLIFASETEGPEVDVTRLRLSDGYVASEMNGADYIFQMFESTTTGCSYVSAVPTRVFWQRTDRLRALSYASMAACLIMSILLTLALTKRNYEPIRNLVNTAAERSGVPYDKSSAGELEFLARVLDTAMVRSDLLETRLDQMNNTMAENFLLRAMQGTVSADESHEDAFVQNGITLLSDAFCVVLVRVEESDAGALARAEALLREQLPGVCAPHQGMAVPLDAEQHALIINYSEKREQAQYGADTDNILSVFAQEMHIQLGLMCTVAVSSVHHGLSGICACYAEATGALKYRFLRGKGSVLKHVPEESRAFNYATLFEPGGARLLLRAVKEEDLQIDAALSRALLNASDIGAGAALEAVECYRYDVISTVNKIILEVGAVRLERENKWIAALFGADTLEQFQDILLSALSQLRAFCRQTETQDSVCGQAMRLIEANYMDCELNNNIISDRLGITSWYLSKLFRLQYGVSMIDCLYTLRIKRSKQLLRETRLTIDEIAAQTGFVSGGALIKLFKKYEGVTPGVFRRLTGNPEND